MRQHITQIVAVTSLCVVAWVAWSQQDTVLSKIKSVVTGSQPAEPAKPATAQAPSKSQADAMLHLYQAPGDIKPIKKLPISSPWIPIIRQG